MLRGTGLAVLSAGAACLLVGAARDALPRGGTPARAEDVLTMLAAAAGAAVACWLTVVVAVCLAALLPGLAGLAAGRLAASLTPTVLRRALSLALTTSVGTVVLPAGPVHADATGPADATATDATATATTGATGSTARALGADPAGVPGTGLTTHSLSAPTPGFVPSLVAPTPGFVATTGTAPAPGDTAHPTHPASPTDQAAVAPSPGWRPDRPTRMADPSRTTLLSPAPRIGSATLDTVVVRRGDTLWSIAARALGPEATDAEIAHEWPRWYAANRDVIGDDPDLLQPGQSLVPPTAEVSR